MTYTPDKGKQGEEGRKGKKKKVSPENNNRPQILCYRHSHSPNVISAVNAILVAGTPHITFLVSL